MKNAVYVLMVGLIGWALLSWSGSYRHSRTKTSVVRPSPTLTAPDTAAQEAIRQRESSRRSQWFALNEQPPVAPPLPAFVITLDSSEGNGRGLDADARPTAVPPKPAAAVTAVRQIHPVTPMVNRWPQVRGWGGILVRQPATNPTYRTLVQTIAYRFQVPAGVLYGIWWKESRWIRHGWGNGGNWHYAPTMIQPSGPCIARYGWEKCSSHYRSLRALCSQQRQGRPICDPNQVRVSYAGAMGPMQHMPKTLLKCDAGGCRWTRNAVDYDGDGTVDPHYLPDAMASTARYLRLRFDQNCRNRDYAERWRCAVNQYYGESSSGYYEGRGSKVGVVHLWKEWCSFPGNCS